MSLITQCPACSTCFKVVPDQLRISDGWVRCGQCDEVFDANTHLQAGAAAVVPSAVPRATPGQGGGQDSDDPTQAMGLHASTDEERVPRVIPAEALFEGSNAEAPPPASPQALTTPKDVEQANWPDDEAPPPTEEEMHAWVLAAVAAEASDLKAQSSALMDAMPRYREVQAPTPNVEPAPSDGLEFALEADTPSDDLLGSDTGHGDAPQLSFLKSATAPSIWYRPKVRVMLFALCVVLGIALVLQIVVRQRDWMVAKIPVTRSVVVAMCDIVGCQLSPLREIESVVIDSSAFVKVRPNVYRVHFTLKNTAVYPVGVPSLELTLTNTDDQAIVRRIFSPLEFGIYQSTMAPGAEVNAVVSIGVQMPDDTERVSGYRLLVFYP